MKAIALYLPQYHEVEENNKWWGKGYTEWSAVKSAQTYSKNQKQPRVPLNENYYDLSDTEAKTWAWQAELAKRYNIYGFAIYHYWFKTGKQLLEKPMEILLSHPEIDLNYCICWANETWTRTWYGVESEVLMLQEYGNQEEWVNHYKYLSRFFHDRRYIKINNKPMVNIYHSFEIDNLAKMIECWNSLAKAEGYDGLYIVSGNTGAKLDNRYYLFDAYYNFEPSYSLMHRTNKLERIKYGVTVNAREVINKLCKHKFIERPINGETFTKRMIRPDEMNTSIIFPGVFPQWDNSPRRKYKGTFFYKMTPENFENQIYQVLSHYKDAEYVYINAWNEWGEGAYLEPDNNNKYKYLEVIHNAVTDFNK